MAASYTVIPVRSGFSITAGDKALHTPGKNSLHVPAKPLAEAIAVEWRSHSRFSTKDMPLTSLAYTALDRIEGRKDQIVEAMLAFADTDTLSYRATGSEDLARRQKREWDPVLEWAGSKFGAAWQVTSDIVSMEQPEELRQSIARYLEGQNSMRLAGAFMLASLYSSLALTLAVLADYIDANEAFRLSRLEEDTQAEVWGRDGETEQRVARMREEVATVKRFLDLLEGT